MKGNMRAMNALLEGGSGCNAGEVALRKSSDVKQATCIEEWLLLGACRCWPSRA